MSLGVRAAIAITLLCGFFALALGGAAGLAWLGVEILSVLAANSVGNLLIVALLDRGFTASADVGDPVRLERGEVVFEPFVESRKYLRGELFPEAWLQRMNELGVADVDLGARERQQFVA